VSTYDPETTPVLLVDTGLLAQQAAWVEQMPEHSRGQKAGLLNLLDEILVYKVDSTDQPAYVTLKLLDGGWADE
jgi:hypothetical protein